MESREGAPGRVTLFHRSSVRGLSWKDYPNLVSRVDTVLAQLGKYKNTELLFHSGDVAGGRTQAFRLVLAGFLERCTNSRREEFVRQTSHLRHYLDLVGLFGTVEKDAVSISSTRHYLVLSLEFKPQLENEGHVAKGTFERAEARSRLADPGYASSVRESRPYGWWNYNVFYALLACGPVVKEKLSLKEVEDYRILRPMKGGQTRKSGDILNAQRLLEALKAMTKPKVCENILASLAACLHLGNVVLLDDKGEELELTDLDETSLDALSTAAHLLEHDSATSLLAKMQEVVDKETPLSEARDRMIDGIYNECHKLISYSSTDRDKRPEVHSLVHMYDMPNFENVKNNSFVQVLMNLVNERIQIELLRALLNDTTPEEILVAQTRVEKLIHITEILLAASDRVGPADLSAFDSTLVKLSVDEPAENSTCTVYHSRGATQYPTNFTSSFLQKDTDRFDSSRTDWAEAFVTLTLLIEWEDNTQVVYCMNCTPHLPESRLQQQPPLSLIDTCIRWLQTYGHHRNDIVLPSHSALPGELNSRLFNLEQQYRFAHLPFAWPDLPAHYDPTRIPSSWTSFKPIAHLDEIDSALNIEEEAIRLPEDAKNFTDTLRVTKGGEGLQRRTDVRATVATCGSWIHEHILYDHNHADSARLYHTQKSTGKMYSFTYLIAEEVWRLRRGICGEMSFLLIGMLRHLGIPACLYCPSMDHLAVVAEDVAEAAFYGYDPTEGAFMEPVRVGIAKRNPEATITLGVGPRLAQFSALARRTEGKAALQPSVGNERVVSAEDCLDAERYALGLPLLFE